MIWSALTGHYFFMASQIFAESSIIIQVLFVVWAKNNATLAPGDEHSTGFLGRCIQTYVMRDLIMYFRQYQVRRNCYELKSTFYESSQCTFDSTIKQFKNQEHAMYEDDDLEEWLDKAHPAQRQTLQSENSLKTMVQSKGRQGLSNLRQRNAKNSLDKYKRKPLQFAPCDLETY